MTVPAAITSQRIGVGIDTARYWHHATFLREDLQPATKALDVQESRAGYEHLRQTFALLAERCQGVHFCVRLDAAGQYATNLEAFLRSLPWPMTLSVGEPKRNQRYREAISPKRKADPVDSRCAARFALLEKPQATPAVPRHLIALREIASRLESQTRLSTRLANQLHNLLGRVFPELDLIVPKLQARWVLKLLAAYPTPQRLAQAPGAELQAVPYARADQVQKLHAAAADTIATLTGAVAAKLVRHLVRQLRASLQAEAALLRQLIADYQALPQANHIDTIPGIGQASAAILTAKIVDIDRFLTDSQLVGYFGTFPEENTSGSDKHGRPQPSRTQRMSRQGNDLVRKYLWNCAKSAVRFNPAVRALYRRLRAKGTRGDVALGHCMRKLLHLVFAVWRSGRPFDPKHYPWQPDQPDADASASAHSVDTAPANAKAAGHNKGKSPKRQVVTAASATVSPAPPPVKPVPAPQASAVVTDNGFVDFAALRRQVSMAQVLNHLGVLKQLRGSGPQRRGRCPIHAEPSARCRTFSVNLSKNVFQCFHPPCAAHGNVLDLWAAVQRLPLPQAARHLAQAFALDLQPTTPTEKRNP